MDERELLSRIDEFIRVNERALVADIGRLVAVPSVEGEPAPGAPFGQGPRRALDTALDIAGEMGLDTCDGGGYVGWAELPGEKAGHIATITHVDVVPEGDGWDGDPFALREREGWLLGRGVMDDKGPSVLSLYAAKFFRDGGIPLKYGLRVLLGCNEETGMADVAHYLQEQPAPLFCFSPDAFFPVCNGEKGNFTCTLVSPELAGNLLSFQVGQAKNVIPASARCTVRRPDRLPQSTDRVAVEDTGGGALRLTATGIGGHAAMPEGTVNAIGLLVDFLLAEKLLSGEEAAYLGLLARLYQSPDGRGLGIDTSDGIFGPLTVNGGVIDYTGGRLRLTLDIRFPTSVTGRALADSLDGLARQYGGGVESVDYNDPLYVPAESAPIRCLTAAYEQVTGRDGTPFTMGGGTYARHFQHAVSFGPSEQDDKLPAFAGPEHGPNEGIRLQTLLTALRVYILSIWKLQGTDLGL